MIKNIVLVFAISILSIISYKFIIEGHEIKHDAKNQNIALQKNDTIQKNTLDTKTNIIAKQKHTKNVAKTEKKPLQPLDKTSHTVEEEQLFVNYLEDTTYKEISNSSSLSQEEKDRMIMDKMYFEGAEMTSSPNITEDKIQSIMEEDIDYQLSKQ